jgi:hypothetical protein
MNDIEAHDDFCDECCVFHGSGELYKRLCGNAKVYAKNLPPDGYAVLVRVHKNGQASHMRLLAGPHSGFFRWTVLDMIREITAH